MTAIIELLFLVFLFLIFVQLCKRFCNRDRPQNPVTTSTSTDNNDLERFRRDAGPRNRGQAAATGGGYYQHTVNAHNAVSSADRQDLVRKNLFTKTISGEKSVLDLSSLLAISRGAQGAMIDEEIGVCNPSGDVAFADAAKSVDVVLVEPCTTHDDLTLNSTLSDMSISPEPSAPTFQTSEVNSEICLEVQPIPSVATEPMTSQQPNESTKGSLRNLLMNLKQNVRRLSHLQTSEEKYPLECSICLDSFNQNDTIAWAKDGGDPTPISCGTDIPGCDHIFHQGKARTKLTQKTTHQISNALIPYNQSFYRMPNILVTATR